MIKNKKSIIKGFSLIEALIAVGVFSIVIVATFGILTSNLNVRKNLKAHQQISEELITAINLISKRVRMSEITSSSGLVDSITVKDSADNNYYVYSFSGNNLKIGSDILATNVVGKFYVSTNNPKRLTITVKPSSAEIDDNKMRIQTTVSTRVYND